MRKSFILLTAATMLLSACESKNSEIEIHQNEWCISGGPIYTANDAQPIVEAVTVKNSKIIYAGDADGDWCESKTSKDRRIRMVMGILSVSVFAK